MIREPVCKFPTLRWSMYTQTGRVICFPFPARIQKDQEPAGNLPSSQACRGFYYDKNLNDPVSDVRDNPGQVCAGSVVK